MAVSILHRVTGNGLAFVGLGVLLWWLGALASGQAAYDSFLGHAGAWYGTLSAEYAAGLPSLPT